MHDHLSRSVLEDDYTGIMDVKCYEEPFVASCLEHSEMSMLVSIQNMKSSSAFTGRRTGEIRLFRQCGFAWLAAAAHQLVRAAGSQAVTQHSAERRRCDQQLLISNLTSMAILGVYTEGNGCQ